MKGEWQERLLPVGILSLSWLVVTAAWAGGTSNADRKRLQAAVDLMPRGFVPNAGQWDTQAAFAAVGFYGSTWVTREGELRHVLLAKGECQEEERLEHSFLGKQERCTPRAWVLSERFVGSQVRGLAGMEKLEGGVSFLVGNDPNKHRSNLPKYRYVGLGEGYPGFR